MFFRENLALEQSIIYLPDYLQFARQDSPQCYYFSCSNLLTMQNLQQPLFIKNIVEECKNASIDEYDNDKYANIIIQSIIENADDLLWIADEIHEDEPDDYEGDWAEDFLGKYGVAFTMARLMNLSVTTFKPEDFNPEQLTRLLKRYGPIAIGMTTSTTLTMPENIFLFNTIKTKNKLVKNIISVDAYQDRGSHMVLLIGYDEKQKQVYFIDPNYPEFISSIHFDLLKKNLHLPEFAHVEENNLQPERIINTNIKRSIHEHSVLHEIQLNNNTEYKKRKMNDAVETNQQRQNTF